MSSRWMSPIKLAAKQVLFDYKISNDPAAGISKVLQGERIELVGVSVDDDSCGMYCIEDDERKIYINSNMSEGRRNFTIAHELGHHFLSHRLNEYCQIYRCINTITHRNDLQEVEANYFAACFLMPYEIIISLFNSIVSVRGLRTDHTLCSEDELQMLALKEAIQQIAGRTKVSHEAAFYRLKNLNLIKLEDDSLDAYYW